MPQKILKIRCLRLMAKNVFAIPRLLHHSIVFLFIHYCTVEMDVLLISYIHTYIHTVQVTFFLLGRIFPLNFYLCLNFYNYLFFLSWK